MGKGGGGQLVEGAVLLLYDLHIFCMFFSTVYSSHSVKVHFIFPEASNENIAQIIIFLGQ